MLFALSCDENPGDSGAVHNGIVERDLNIKVASALGTALQRCGQQVWADFSITYVDRVAKANAMHADVLVACAHNASSDPNAEGAQLIICPGGDALFNQLNIANVVGQHLVADAIAEHYGIIHESVYECCAFNKGTVYVEFLFETNARDVAKMKTETYPVDAAESLCRALAQAYNFKYIPTNMPPAPVNPVKSYFIQFVPDPHDDLHPADAVMPIDSAITLAYAYCQAHPQSKCEVVIIVGPIVAQ